MEHVSAAEELARLHSAVHTAAREMSPKPAQTICGHTIFETLMKVMVFLEINTKICVQPYRAESVATSPP